MNLEGKRVLVFGAGRSGIAAAKLLQKLDAAVVLYEENKNTDTASLKDKLDTGRNFKAYFGNFPDQGLDRIDLMILSPGISAGHPFVMSVKKKGIPVWGELELAFRNSRGKVIAITGTNGKTTTTSLTGEIMRTYFKEVFVAGNIGKPYSDIALETTDESVSVIEVSSFQLETIYTFRPNISAILNITPDHLDRHHTMDNYIGLKKDITRNQNMDDLCILNYDDENIKKLRTG